MRGEAVVVVDCRGAMGITGRPWRLETRVTPSVSFSIRPVDGILAGRRFRLEKSALFLSDPRVDGSERGGSGLPGVGDRTAAESLCLLVAHFEYRRNLPKCRHAPIIDVVDVASAHEVP